MKRNDIYRLSMLISTLLLVILSKLALFISLSPVDNTISHYIDFYDLAVLIPFIIGYLLSSKNYNKPSFIVFLFAYFLTLPYIYWILKGNTWIWTGMLALDTPNYGSIIISVFSFLYPAYLLCNGILLYKYYKNKVLQ